MSTSSRKSNPMMAVIPDVMNPQDIDRTMSIGLELAPFVSECLIVVPKFTGYTDSIPQHIEQTPIRVGYSVKTRYGGTEVPLWEFTGRDIHLLGGNPRQQMYLLQYLNVKSLDGNMCSRIAQYGRHYTPRGDEKKIGEYHDSFYDAVELSLSNLKTFFATGGETI